MDPLEERHPHAVLRTAKIIWSALVAGVLVFGGVVAFLTIRPRSVPPHVGDDLSMYLFYVSLGFSILAVPMAIFARGQIFKAGWAGDIVRPMAYFQGSIVAWAMCDGAALAGLVVCLVSQSMWPYAISTAIGLGGLLLLWPNGRAMFPRRDPYAVGER
jgi:hypothetical protein